MQPTSSLVTLTFPFSLALTFSLISFSPLHAMHPELGNRELGNLELSDAASNHEPGDYSPANYSPVSFKSENSEPDSAASDNAEWDTQTQNPIALHRVGRCLDLVRLENSSLSSMGLRRSPKRRNLLEEVTSTFPRIKRTPRYSNIRLLRYSGQHDQLSLLQSE